MRNKLTVNEVELVIGAAEKVAKTYVSNLWKTNWNIAALEHLKHLESNLSKNSAQQSSIDHTNTQPESLSLSVLKGGKMPSNSDIGSEEGLAAISKASGAQKELDTKFFEIVEKLSEVALGTLSDSVNSILSLSKHYLAEEAQGALNDFYQLYFCASGSQQMKESVAVNDEVERIMAALEEGGEDSIQEDDIEKEKRLAMSSVQKRLETIISLDEDLKEKLLPVLTSMQFEELTTHRLRNLQSILGVLHQESKDPKLKEKSLHLEIFSNLTSSEEKKQYIAHFPESELSVGEENVENGLDKVFLF